MSDFENGPESITEVIMEILSEVVFSLPRPFEDPYSHMRRMRRGREREEFEVSRKKYFDAVKRLEKRGALEVINENNQRFIKLTEKGQLEILFKKAGVKQVKLWDNKWRLFMFDIPEASKDKRDVIRSFLKRSGFYKLQASVYVSPYELNREALVYLKNSFLIEYIRIVRVEEMDNDEELLKYFNLTNK